MSKAREKSPIGALEIHKLGNDISSLRLHGGSRPPSHHSRKKCKSAICVPFHTFQHSELNYFPEETDVFLEDCTEVATYQNGCLFTKDSSKKPIYPCLQILAALIAENRNTKSKLPYIGCDLYEGHERYKPLSSGELDSSMGCFQYIRKWERRKISSYNGGNITVISPRHHVVDLIMALYGDDEVSIICTNMGKGKLLFSEDKSKEVVNGVQSKNPMTRKICYSGFALEDKLTMSHEDRVGPFYSIVEGKINDKITMVLRCEMDAYNPIFERYTELKCYNKLNVQETSHRRKLLKTWVQIGLIPNSDLIIGTRDTQLGQLKDLTWFSKETLYQKFNNTSIACNKKYFNFNANIAIEWCYHCIESICDLVMSNSVSSLDDPYAEHESFKVIVDKSHNIVIRKLTKVPKHVQIPKFFQ